MRRAVLVMALAVAGCAPKAPEAMVQKFEGKQLYTCCNIYHQGDEVSDVNYRDGTMIAVGTPVTIGHVGANSLTFTAGGEEIELAHLYGRNQESAEQYFEKVFVSSNRGEQVDKFPAIVRNAIREGRVEQGMKRGEVVLSLGFPPTDDNPVPTASEWTYWYGKGQSYKVRFDSNGYVSEIVGSPSPTKGKPVRVYASEPQ